MEHKQIWWLTVAVNLIVGNFILHLMAKNSDLIGQIFIHIVASTVASLMLITLFNKVPKSANFLVTIAVSLLGALSVPFATAFIFTAFTGIKESIPDSVVKAGFFVIVSVFGFWYFWIPFGVLNALLLYKYSHNRIGN